MEIYGNCFFDRFPQFDGTFPRRSARYRRFQTMDHTVPLLKVAGTGLNGALYAARSPVRQKRRGMGSDSEGGAPPPYHDPPGACLTARGRIRDVLRIIPSSPLPKPASTPFHRCDDENVRCSFRPSTAGCDPPAGRGRGESSAGQRVRGLQEVSAFETPGEALAGSPGIWGCPRHHLPHQFGPILTGGG